MLARPPTRLTVTACRTSSGTSPLKVLVTLRGDVLLVVGFGEDKASARTGVAGELELVRAKEGDAVGMDKLVAVEDVVDEAGEGLGDMIGIGNVVDRSTVVEDNTGVAVVVGVGAGVDVAVGVGVDVGVGVGAGKVVLVFEGLVDGDTDESALALFNHLGLFTIVRASCSLPLTAVVVS